MTELIIENLYIKDEVEDNYNTPNNQYLYSNNDASEYSYYKEYLEYKEQEELNEYYDQDNINPLCIRITSNIISNILSYIKEDELMLYEDAGNTNFLKSFEKSSLPFEIVDTSALSSYNNMFLSLSHLPISKNIMIIYYNISNKYYSLSQFNQSKQYLQIALNINSYLSDAVYVLYNKGVLLFYSQ